MRFWAGKEGMQSPRGWPKALLVAVLTAGWLAAGCGGPAERCGPIQFVNGQATEPKVVVVLLDGATSQERGGKFYPVPVANPNNGMPVVTNYLSHRPKWERAEQEQWLA